MVALRKQLLNRYLDSKAPEDSPEDAKAIEELHTVDDLLALVKGLKGEGQTTPSTLTTPADDMKLIENDPLPQAGTANSTSAPPSIFEDSSKIYANPDADPGFTAQGTTVSSTGGHGSSGQSTASSSGRAQQLRKAVQLLRGANRIAGQLKAANAASGSGTGAPAAFAPANPSSGFTPAPAANPTTAAPGAPASAANPVGTPPSSGAAVNNPASPAAAPSTPSVPSAANSPVNNPNSALGPKQVVGSPNNGPVQPPSWQQPAVAAAPPAPPPPPDECDPASGAGLRKQDSQLINENASLFLNQSPKKQREILRKLRHLDSKRLTALGQRCEQRKKAAQLAQQQQQQAKPISAACQEAQKIKQTQIGANGYVLTQAQIQTLTQCDQETQASKLVFNAIPPNGCLPSQQLNVCVTAKVIWDSKQPQRNFTAQEFAQLLKCPLVTRKP